MGKRKVKIDNEIVETKSKVSITGQSLVPYMNVLFSALMKSNYIIFFALKRFWMNETLLNCTIFYFGMSNIINANSFLFSVKWSTTCIRIEREECRVRKIVLTSWRKIDRKKDLSTCVNMYYNNDSKERVSNELKF